MNAKSILHIGLVDSFNHEEKIECKSDEQYRFINESQKHITQVMHE